jgi:chemotaxis-related protein WspD
MKPDQPNDDSALIAELQVAGGGELAEQINDCWNTIGVNGNGSCRELLKFVHCRNCPVYSTAGVKLLDRPITPEYRRQWAGHYAQEKKMAAPVRTSVVIFRVGSEWLAMSTRAFQEVAEKRAVHSLPHRRRNIVLGLVNVRGELLICVSLGRLLGLEQGSRLETRGLIYDRLIVASWNGNRYVFPADEVHGIHRLNQEDLREPPATVSHSSLTHTQGVFHWKERTVGVLNADSLFAAMNRNLS